MKKRYILLIILTTFFVGINTIYAHPGRTDSSGCHVCRTNCESWGYTTGTRHCHNGEGTSYTKTVTKKVAEVKSKNNNVKEIKVNNEKAKIINDIYVVKTYDTKVNISVTPEDTKATITNDKEHELDKYENRFIINVTAENGDSKIYNVLIYKISNNNYLKNLEVENYDINFDKEKQKYLISVENNVDEINIKATTDDMAATVEGTGVKKIDEVGKIYY